MTYTINNYTKGPETNYNEKGEEVELARYIKIGNGDFYYGDLKNGKCYGKGQYNFANGSMYIGDFVDGHLEGIGIMKYNDEQVDYYKGEFKNDKINGKGMKKWKSGSTYTGFFENNEIVSGSIGTINYSNKTVYVGYTKNTSLDGKGIFTNTKNGFYIKGIFKSDSAFKVKYYNNKAEEITKSIYLEAIKKDNQISNNFFETKNNILIPNKADNLLEDLIIPAPNGVNFLSNRFGFPNVIVPIFSEETSDKLYLKQCWRKKPYYDRFTIFNGSDVMDRLDLSRSYPLSKKFNQVGYFDEYNNYNRGGYYDPPPKIIGYVNDTLRIKVNDDKDFNLDNTNNFTIALTDSKNKKDIFTIDNFNIWNNKKEKNKFYSDLTEYYKLSEPQFYKQRKNDFDKNYGGIKDVYAVYDEAKNIARIQFAIGTPSASEDYYFLFEIDFKNKTYKKIGESQFKAILKKDHWVYCDKFLKWEFENDKIIYFDENYSTINLDSTFFDKINMLVPSIPLWSLKYVTSNSNYIIIEGGLSYYFFINKKTLECEKIVHLILPKDDKNNYAERRYEDKGKKLAWNKNLTKSALTLAYKLNPSDQTFVSCIYIINWNTLEVDLIKDSKYQLLAIQNEILLQKEADKEYQEIQARQRANTEIYEELSKGNMCTLCNGKGRVENNSIRTKMDMLTMLPFVTCPHCKGTGLD